MSARGGNKPTGKASGAPAGGDDLVDQQELAAPPEGVPADEVEVDELIANLGASAAAARIIVHRITPNNDPEECIDCPLPVFSKDHLRETFGPGQYRCEVRHKGVIKRRWEWRFAAPLRAPGAVPGAAPATSRLAELEAELRSNREKESQRAHELTLALLGRPQAQGLQLGDLVDILGKAREFLGGGGSGDGKSTIAQFKEFLEMRELLGGSASETSPTDVALEGLKALREAFTLAPPSAAAQPGSGSAKVAPPAPATVSSRISSALALLAKHAAAGTAPDRIASFVLQAIQQLPDAEYEAICSFIEQDGAVGLLILAEPGLANYRPWAEQVAAQLRAQISNEGEEGQPPQPA